MIHVIYNFHTKIAKSINNGSCNIQPKQPSATLLAVTDTCKQVLVTCRIAPLPLPPAEHMLSVSLASSCHVTFKAHFDFVELL